MGDCEPFIHADKLNPLQNCWRSSRTILVSTGTLEQLCGLDSDLVVTARAVARHSLLLTALQGSLAIAGLKPSNLGITRLLGRLHTLSDSGSPLKPHRSTILSHLSAILSSKPLPCQGKILSHEQLNSRAGLVALVLAHLNGGFLQRRVCNADPSKALD